MTINHHSSALIIFFRGDQANELGVFDMATGDCRLCMAVNHLPEPVTARIKIPKATKLLETVGNQVNGQRNGDELAVEVRLDALSGVWFTFR